MNKKAATPSLTIKLENVTILVNQVKGDQSLFRVMVDNTFKGYVMIQGKEIELVSGSSINENYIDEIGKSLMFLIAIKFMGAFADGDKVVEPSMANGGGGCGYIIMVGNNYWGKVLYEMDDWYVDFQTRKMDILQVICNR